ncbi:MAG: hypothetical protein ACI8Z5_000527 [Lentimonas sp.]|jgi:hypothetical protein
MVILRCFGLILNNLFFVIKSLNCLILCFVCWMSSIGGATEYERQLVAVPLSVFEQCYTIEASP